MQIFREQKNFQGRDQHGSEAGSDLVRLSHSKGAGVAGGERARWAERSNAGPDEEGHPRGCAGLKLIVDETEAVGRFCAKK